jgi:hypothetical protein
MHNISDVQKNVNFIMEHLNDPNFNLSHPPSFASAIEEELTRRYGQDGNEAIYFDESDLFIPLSHFIFLTTYHSESPYPEVRASVSSVDDPLMPVNTFRMWFLGILLALLNSGFNQVFFLRCMSLSPLSFDIILSTSFQIPPFLSASVISQLVCLPLGQGLAAILPTKCFNTFGYIWSLNPGPFSIKEHVCISVMVSSTNMGSTQTMSHSYNMFYMAKPPP